MSFGKSSFAIAGAVLIGLITSQHAFAAEKKDAAAPPEMKLPPGWTAEDMQACMMAATPGKMHEWLREGVGVWQGKTQMWMIGSTEPMTSECISTASAMMDGRFVKVETVGEMPGMGAFTGFGVYGFDNVSQKFVCTWLDNYATGMMNGTGELSADGKTLSWTFSCNCPLTKKPTVVREVETFTSPTTKSLEMFGIDPKSGKEFKMMRIDFTKK